MTSKCKLLKENYRQIKTFSTTIKVLEQHDIYKYFGIDEHDGIQQKSM